MNAQKVEQLENAIFEGSKHDYSPNDPQQMRDAKSHAKWLVVVPPRVIKECPSVRYACKRLGIKNTYKAIREYVEYSDESWRKHYNMED